MKITTSSLTFTAQKYVHHTNDPPGVRAWHTSACFNLIRPVFESLGCPTIAPDLPFRLEISFAGVVGCIGRESKALVEDDKDVLVFPGSYGTVVTTEAVTPEFEKIREDAREQRR